MHMSLKQTILSAATAVIMIGSSLIGGATAASGQDLRTPTIIVDGQIVQFPDTKPYINDDGRTMVPVRFVTERLGAEVKWEADTKTAIIKYKGKTIRMPAGSKTVDVDGRKQELDTAAQFIEGRTMVPLRFISEILGSQVEWDSTVLTATIQISKHDAKPGETPTVMEWKTDLNFSQDPYLAALANDYPDKVFLLDDVIWTESVVIRRLENFGYKLVLNVRADQLIGLDKVVILDTMRRTSPDAQALYELFTKIYLTGFKSNSELNSYMNNLTNISDDSAIFVDDRDQESDFQWSIAMHDLF